MPFFGPIRTFDLHPDGQRFVLVKTADEQAEARRGHVVLIQNFSDVLRRIAPAGKP